MCLLLTRSQDVLKQREIPTGALASLSLSLSFSRWSSWWGTILGGTAVTAPGVSLAYVFFFLLGPHRRILGRNKKTGPGGQCNCILAPCFVEMSHILNISHQYPLWGIIYPSILQHTFEVLHNPPQFSFPYSVSLISQFHSFDLKYVWALLMSWKNLFASSLDIPVCSGWCLSGWYILTRDLYSAFTSAIVAP